MCRDIDIIYVRKINMLFIFLIYFIVIWKKINLIELVIKYIFKNIYIYEKILYLVFINEDEY